jgi:hypothetical protein
LFDESGRQVVVVRTLGSNKKIKIKMGLINLRAADLPVKAIAVGIA